MSRDNPELIHSEGGISDNSAGYDQRLAMAKDMMGKSEAVLLVYLMKEDGEEGEEEHLHNIYLKKPGIESADFLPAALNSALYTATRILEGEHGDE